MDRDPGTTEKLAQLISHLTSLTAKRALHWERRVASAHRYAQWNNNLLILGPAEPMDENVPRYFFITPFDSPTCVEVSSSDDELGSAVLNLVNTVEEFSKDEPPTDPFSITADVLTRITS